MRFPRHSALTPFLFALSVLAHSNRLQAQDVGAAALGPLVQGLGVTARVLVIAAHPDDEDTQLITWLAKGRHVETAYLSLTRGDGGQNLIGNELGESLGAIRTEELLAARRIDGGRQYFTRAFDFGFSKNAEETLTQWSRDSILRDVVTVVRQFRPHVIVAVFSGTPADGHGHHQVSGQLAREVYDISADTVRFPRAATAGFGAWSVAKFYRGAAFRNQDKATIRMNVGEYDPILGRSYAEIASQSRSQHKSQAFGVLQLKGARMDQLLREATRVNAAQDAKSEQSLFDGVDTTWTRFAALMNDAAQKRALDSMPIALRQLQSALDLFHPERELPELARISSLLQRICGASTCGGAGRGGASELGADFSRTIDVFTARFNEAVRLAAGVAVEATVSREVWASGERVPVRVAVYNRGRLPVAVNSLGVGAAPEYTAQAVSTPQFEIAPDSARRDSVRVAMTGRSEPWWLATPRKGAMFSVPVMGVEESTRGVSMRASMMLTVGGVTVPFSAPVTFRYADAIRGEINRPVAVAPAITLLLDNELSYAPANTPIERAIRVHVSSHASEARNVDVRLTLPAGLVADSAVRHVSFAALAAPSDVGGFGAAFGFTGSAPPEVVRTVTFNVRGRLTPGRHEVRAVATSNGETFASGFVVPQYDHIRPQRLYRQSSLGIEAVDVKVPRGTSIAYIAGVGDNSAPMLEQLGVNVTMIDPATLPRTDLSKFTAVVVGSRAYEANDALVANNARLLDYAKEGGTLVVQYGQYEMTRPGILPYPITLSRPAERVTVENAPVRIVDPAANVLNAPNHISTADFTGWVQDLALYMPSTFDPVYKPVLEMNDPGEKPNRGAILVAPVGKGTYVYTTLALFRQLPNGVPGAARLVVNLLSARPTSIQP